SETTAGQLEWWLLAMTAFPEAQKRAQEELDTVIGHARTPRVADRGQMPYVDALSREVTRWRLGIPTGAPHITETDDWYEGMFIPKGTLLFANMHPCNLDPRVYGDDAHLFNPARFLDEKGQLRPMPEDTKEEGHVSFGFGRRICVGRHVANDALFVAMATMLWAFEIEKIGEVDVEGFRDEGFTM
ncbi:cytochrome P450, partial [Vararia minispora EC-137]